MPLSILVGQAAMAVLHEWSQPGGAGVELPPVGPVTYASDNPAAATVDPNTGVILGVAAGTANITGTDAGNALSASDSVTVAVLVAASATLVISPMVVNPLRR